MQYGPKIVTNGLVLALDAAEANSYGPIKAEVLVVAGGGAGGGYHGGGGGAGGVLYTSNYTIARNTTYTVTVGQGGAGANSTSNTGDPGGNSIFSGASTVLTAVGGGAGKSQGNATQARNNGGSGGGGCDGNSSSITGGSGTAGQGFNGGDVSAESGPALAVYYGTAGGGGAGGVGGTGGIANGGFGGPGLPFYISGTTQYYGGGGGGTNLTNVLTYGIGGIGGGGTGGVSPSPHNSPLRYSTSGSANTGGGGGGYLYSGHGGGSGGSGIVIIRYKGPQKATGGTITTVDNETVHTFTSSGSFVAGTNFADLSGNNITCTLTGSPVFNSANNGSIVFNGSTQISTFTPTPTILQGNPNFTVIGFYKRTGNFSSKGFWGIGGSNAGGTGQGICNWNYGNTNEIAIDSWGESTFTTGQTYPLNTWIGVAWRKIAGPTTRANCIISLFDGTNITHYTSTALTVLRAESATNLNINSIGGITLGSISVDTGYCSPVNIANHCIYNRLLSDAEILLNFQATKARFGL